MAEPAPGEYGYTGGSGDYGVIEAKCPTAPDFRPLKIDQHVTMLAQLRNDSAHAAAQLWGNAANLFEATRDNMVSYADSLSQAWRSQAAEPFFTHIGGTLYSLRLWAQAARANEAALHRLGDAIQTAQTEMATLYGDFTSEVERIDKNEFGPSDFLGMDDGAEAMTDMVNEKTAQSRAIMETLASNFTQTRTAVEGKFAGPADARPVSPEQMAQALGGSPGGAPAAPAGGGGGGAPGAPPGAPPAAPTMQAMLIPGQSGMMPGPPPVAPPRPPAPVAPAIPRGAPPMAPPMPAHGLGPPPAAPGLGSPGTMGGPAGPPPAAPVIGSAGAPSSGLAGTRGAPPAAPSMGAGPGGGAQALRGAPPAPPGGAPTSAPGNALQGRNGAGAPALPPGGRGAPPRSAAAQPQIPGRAGGPGSPGMAPPAPPGSRGLGNRPAAPGRGAQGAPGLQGRQAPRAPGGMPGGMGPPGSGVPRSLQGRGAPEGSRAGRSSNGRAPIRPGTPGSAGQPGLRGRSGPVRAARSETAQTARAALRRGLDGRGITTGRSGPASAAASGPAGRPATAAPAQRKDEKAAAAVSKMVGDEKLFVVDPAAPAVIERQQEKVHAKRPGPALGRG